jgi:hypothetical protein
MEGGPEYPSIPQNNTIMLSHSLKEMNCVEKKDIFMTSKHDMRNMG